MDVNSVRAVANAILYEGYMLYPYRPSALKNRSQGWTFGTLLPEAYAADHPGEPAAFCAEVLLAGAQPRLSVETRFLQLSGADAVERTVSLPSLALADLENRAVELPFSFPEAPTASLSRVRGMVRVAARRVSSEVAKIILSVSNQSSPETAWDTRDGALKQALVSAHALLTATDAQFISLLNPPHEYACFAADCKQQGVFPVLAGDEGDRSAMLVSPIILYDYPQIAATSHGDFFDSSEIDEMLTLRVLTLTEEEKQEIRAADPRARALLQRTESLAPGDVLKLHGVLRGMSPRQE